MDKISLPPDFNQLALAQFDGLVKKGKLFYAPPVKLEEVVCKSGLKVQFLSSPAIKKKPILPRDAPERKGRGGPFIDPDPAFVVARLGSGHVLEFSMHAMLRPHYVLHTREFRPQTEDLDLGDWAAIDAVMRAVEGGGGSHRRVSLGPATKAQENGVVAVTVSGRAAANGVKPSVVNGVGRTGTGASPPAVNDNINSGSNRGIMMIYNCGYDGGASQGHKHVQIFQEREVGEIASLFPSKAESTDVIADRIPGVSIQHFVLRLRPGAGIDDIIATYKRLLAEVRKVQAEFGGGPDNNVILTREWMCMIPRRRGGSSHIGAAALGMLGIVWVSGQDEIEGWKRLGIEEHMEYMGYPFTR